ncbi:MAG: SDR family oxidoreductase [Actinobacteria bacterium]|mgnify:CR=1 FL=1|nr:SDR family oxidoreductase [Actinomycetota bacterium]
MQLQGKVALITGGGTGIGAAVAQRFVAEGAKVVITGRRRGMLEEVASSVPADSIAIFAGDVTEEGNAQKMVEAALGFTGRLDILVNNAAIEINSGVVDMDPADWRKMLEVNLTGPFLMMKAAIPTMMEKGGGSIINVASLAGVVAVPGGPAYCATKAGLMHLTKQVALDYGKQGVRCNVVCPGPIRTKMLEGNFEPMAEVLKTDMDGVFKEMGKHVPIGHTAFPEDIAGLFVFLGSDDSSFMTGSTVLIDGGVHIVDPFAAAIGQYGAAWA